MDKNRDRRARVNISNTEQLNSPADDFAPVYLGETYDQLVLTSNRHGSIGKKIDQWWGMPFSDLFVSQMEGGNWSVPEPLDNLETINSELHEGSAFFSKDKTRMYFTRCEKWDEKKRYCAILFSHFDDTTWSKPEVVFADTNANFGHPTLSKDELTIIFSSNMKGGEGGKDLYIAKRSSIEENFGRPSGIGKEVNSFADDMFPFLFGDTLLFFASEGYVGYGGLDIYRSVFRDNTWSKPENLYQPINSGYDDFGFILKSINDKGYMEDGYFSSNRPGGNGGDDIYRLERRILQFTLSGVVKDNMNLLPLPDATVSLTRTNGEKYQVMSDDNGKFFFDNTQVLEDSEYELAVRKANYFADVSEVSTYPYWDDHDIQVEVVLEPIPEKPIVLPDILYPLDEWILLPQYQDSLRGLVKLLNENPTLVIELRSHTDSRASHQYNDVLSQKRAQSVVDFLVSKDIEAGRMVAKGYGERVFRVLDKDITREGYTFKKGTLLDDDYIYSLPTKEIQEAAFQLNRRTEFAVIAKDFKSTGQAQGGKLPTIEVISDSTVQAVNYSLTQDDEMMVFTYINDFSTKTVVSMDVDQSVIGEAVVLDLLRKGAVNRNDFEGNFDEIMVDGHITLGSRVNLAKVRLGELVVNKIILTIQSGDTFVMGEDLLSRFGGFRIDDSKQQIIFNQ
jgi:peptidoglycan-associated lipoprotein